MFIDLLNRFCIFFFCIKIEKDRPSVIQKNGGQAFWYLNMSRQMPKSDERNDSQYDEFITMCMAVATQLDAYSYQPTWI